MHSEGAPPDPHLFAFLRVDEQLLDVGDDLCDYEDDVLRNSFNVLRGFVHLYGRDAPLRLAAHISRLEGEHARLLALLPRDLQDRWQQRKVEAATNDAALRWVFPPLILDEAAFRECD